MPALCDNCSKPLLTGGNPDIRPFYLPSKLIRLKIIRI